MGRDTGIADRLRRRGLKVVEVAGWQTRGNSSFSPRGSVDHHTAGSSRGNAPSLAVCTYGRAGLSGPLCNVLVGRDNTCYVIAAGRANHAGRGGWNGLRYNSSVYGVERENVGYASREPWRPDQDFVAGVVHAALIEGRASAQNVCEHKEWAPSRKIDAHTVNGNDMRHFVGEIHKLWAKQYAPEIPQPPPDKPIDYAKLRRLVATDFGKKMADQPNLDGNSEGVRVALLQQVLNFVSGTKLEVDGKYGPKTIQAVVNFQNFMNYLSPGVIKDFPGAVHETTRWMLVASLNQIARGEA